MTCSSSVCGFCAPLGLFEALFGHGERVCHACAQVVNIYVCLCHTHTHTACRHRHHRRTTLMLKLSMRSTLILRHAEPLLLDPGSNADSGRSWSNSQRCPEDCTYRVPTSYCHIQGPPLEKDGGDDPNAKKVLNNFQFLMYPYHPFLGLRESASGGR